MGKVLIIGAGGVGSVTAHKCAMNDDVFGEICIASRTLEKCEQIKESINSRVKGSKSKIHTAWVDADKTHLVVDLIKSFKPDIVINVALPYQNLSIMEACLQTGVHYLDTANYEHPDEAFFEYKHQWAYREKYQKAHITALLGSGFDPGVTGVFCAYAQKHYLDEIHTIDILDCNAGDHGYPFATNFNPEINIREITAKGKYFENGEFVETEPLEFKRVYNFPEIGPRDIYLIHHEEIESLCQNIKGVKRIRFWMTFSDNYLNHLRVLQNVGMTSIEPIDYEGKQIVPLQFLKAVLPDPASLGPRTKGKTNIGCVFTGIKDGKPKTYYVYNVCDHQECYKEVGSQAVSYTTGVPAMIGARLIITGTWKKPGVYNIEEFDPDPFMDQLNKQGLPWKESFSPELLG
jgi:saccharopine dehydrogenase (NAD+, L-lysine-forming)